MKKGIIAAVAIILLGGMTHAQEGIVYKYWVSLKDKAGSAYEITRPESYLSPRSLERRRLQGIAIDSLDLPVSESYIQTLIDSGYMVQNKSKWLNGVTVFAPDEVLGSRLWNFPFVTDVKLCDIATVKCPVEDNTYPVVHYEPNEWRNIGDSLYGMGLTQIDQLGGIPLHKDGYQGQGLIIGVCDVGFPGVDTIQPFDSLRQGGRLLASRDFVWGGEDVYSIHAHGTLVLSTMAAYLPGIYVGTAPLASYVLCRTENTLSETPLEEYNWVAAAEYLDSLGADIVTSSLGYFYFDSAYQSYTLEDLDGNTAPMTIASNIAFSRGMLILNAAGNDGAANPQHLNVPADAEHVLTVGATMRGGGVAPFSSHGPTADGRTKPDVLALGVDVACFTRTGELNRVNGTSLATPIMAGMMACLWQRYPDWTPQQLCDSVRAWGNMADAVDEMGGYGIPNFGRCYPSNTVENNLTADAVSLRLYPNPAHRGSRLRLPADRANVTIFDALGRKVETISVSNGMMVVNTPANGVFYVRIVLEDGNSSMVKLLVL